MTLIDTSAWVEYFRRNGEPAAKERVNGLFQAGEAAYACPIYFELLAGLRATETTFTEQVLSMCHRLLFLPEYWEVAARADRGLRQQGLTVKRGDLFVAVVASESQLPLLCRDRHFDIIRDNSDLELDLEQLA